MALVGVVGGTWLCRFDFGAITYLAGTLTSGQRRAVIFRVPKSGIIDTVEFRMGAVTTPRDLKVSLQDASLSAGNPDGVIDQFRVVPQAAVLANTWIVPGLLTSTGADGGVKRTVTRGEYLALVIEYDSAAGSVTLSTHLSSSSWSAHEFEERFVGSVWSATENIANIAIKYSDGSYACVEGGFATSDQTAYDFDINTTPDEYALRFQLPWDASLAGAILYLQSTTASIPAYNVVLYSATDAVMMTMPGMVLQSATPEPVFVLFPARQFILRNTTYRLAILPTTTTQIKLYTFGTSSANIMAACPGGVEWYLSSRVDGGAWTDTTTRRPWVSLGIAALSDGL